MIDIRTPVVRVIIYGQTKQIDGLVMAARMRGMLTPFEKYGVRIDEAKYVGWRKGNALHALNLTDTDITGWREGRVLHEAVKELVVFAQDRFNLSWEVAIAGDALDDSVYMTSPDPQNYLRLDVSISDATVTMEEIETTEGETNGEA